MSTVPARRAAREQALPDEEAQLLNSLMPPALYVYCKELYEAGWTLRSIGEALNPKRSRSTIRSWVLKETPPMPPVAPTPASPELKTPAVYEPKRPASPGIPPALYAQISADAPIARKFRSGMSPLHKAALANQRLTDTCVLLFESGVPIQELADAAGVTYKAMARRVGRKY